MGSCGTLLSGTRTSSSTPTLVSSVLQSTLTSVSPSTPSAPWSCMLARGVMSAGHIFSPLLRELTRACATLVLTSQSSLLENLVLGRLRTPRRLSHTLLPSALLARGRRERHLLRTKLSRPILCLKLGEMPKLSEMTIHPALESSSESISINLENCLELTWLFICWKNLD